MRPFDCFKGSILVAPQDPAQAVEEIDRLGDRPRHGAGADGQRIATRRSVAASITRSTRRARATTCPLALHLGGEGAGMSPPSTAVGHPSTYFEWYGGDPAELYGAYHEHGDGGGLREVSRRCKVVLYEGGVFWLPHIMWRFDKNWKAQRSETPWVKEPPSAYILRHFYSSTYPLEMIGRDADRAGTGDDRGGADAALLQQLSELALRRPLRDGRGHPRRRSNAA